MQRWTTTHWQGATLFWEDLFCPLSRSWTQPEVRLLWRYVIWVVLLEALCRSVEDLEWLLLSVDVRSSELQRNILINGDWSPQLLESDGRSYVMPSDLCTALPLLGSMQPKCQQPKTNIDLGPRSLLMLCKRLIGEVVQSRRRPLFGPSPAWKRLLVLSHLRHY